MQNKLLQYIEDNNLNQQSIINYSGGKALEMVKRNGYDLVYVKEQTPEIALAAVKENGWALEYVDKRLLKTTKISIDLTQKQLDKIKQAGIL